MKMDKMRHVEAIPEWSEGGIKESKGVSEFNKIYCKNFCTFQYVPPVQQKYN
jgi:hypothetical protein